MHLPAWILVLQYVGAWAPVHAPITALWCSVEYACMWTCAVKSKCRCKFRPKVSILRPQTLVAVAMQLVFEGGYEGQERLDPEYDPDNPPEIPKVSRA
jgi:hypothetical protein